jgi:hypothetical protein
MLAQRSITCMATALSVGMLAACAHARRLDPLASIRHDHAPTPAEQAEAAQDPPLTQMRSALRAIASAQELYYEAHNTYTTHVDTLRQMPACAYSAQVTVIVLAASTLGWAAKSVHPVLPGRSCVQWVASPGQIEVPLTDHDHRRGDALPGGVVCDSVP